MNLDPEWPLYQSLLQGPVLLALGVFTAMIAGSWFLYRRYRRDSRFAFMFAFVLWFFGTIVISSGLVPLPDLMAEHRAYLPSLGIFAAVACFLDRLRTSPRAAAVARILVPTVAVGCVATLCYTTVQRNEIWSTKVGLWEDTVAKSPNKYRAWNNLGAAYQAAGNYEKALSSFQKAKDIEPRYEVPYLNRAICLNILNRNKEALDELNALIKVSEKTGKNLDVQYQYGLALLGIGQVDKGMNLLQKIAEAVPEHRPSHVMVGFVYSRNNMPRRALKYWKQAVALGEPSPELARLIQEAEASAKEKHRID
jgi:tetratricopeptide (TPR) repeat protein